MSIIKQDFGEISGGKSTDIQAYTDKIVFEGWTPSWTGSNGTSSLNYYVNSSIDYFDAILIFHIESGRNYTGISLGVGSSTNDSVFEILEILETPRYQSASGTSGSQDTYRNYWKLKVRFTNGTKTTAIHNLNCKVLTVSTTGYGAHPAFSLNVTDVVYV